MANLSSVIEKINNLRNLAKNNSSAAESEAATRFANKLIEEYRLSEAELEQNNESEVEPVMEDSNPVFSAGRISSWRSGLFDILAKHYGCACFIGHGGNRQSNLRIIGRKSDIEIVKYMFAWLSLEAERLAKNESSFYSFSKSEGRVFANNYKHGFINGIESQLISSKKEVEKSANPIAIIKLNERTKESDDFMRNKHKLSTSHSYFRENADAQAAGFVQGKNIHLGKSMGKGNLKLLGNG